MPRGGVVYFPVHIYNSLINEEIYIRLQFSLFNGSKLSVCIPFEMLCFVRFRKNNRNIITRTTSSLSYRTIVQDPFCDRDSLALSSSMKSSASFCAGAKLGNSLIISSDGVKDAICGCLDNMIASGELDFLRINST